jgi:CheY-like chemotaxis protein
MAFRGLVVAKRILFVDDDPIARALAVAALESDSVNVTVAADGRDALAALGASRFDLLLLDLEMPGIDGFAVLDAVRRSPKTATMPVVVVTGRTDDRSLDQVYRRGANGFAAKPVDWRMLRHQLRFVLRAHLLAESAPVRVA